MLICWSFHRLTANKNIKNNKHDLDSGNRNRIRIKNITVDTLISLFGSFDFWTLCSSSLGDTSHFSLATQSLTTQHLKSSIPRPVSLQSTARLNSWFRPLLPVFIPWTFLLVRFPKISLFPLLTLHSFIRFQFICRTIVTIYGCVIVVWTIGK